MFDDEFIEQLPNDPLKAAHMMCDRFMGFVSEEDPDYEDYLEALGAFEAFCEAYGIPLKYPDLGESRKRNTQDIRSFFFATYSGLDKQLTNAQYRDARDRYRIRFGVAFAYEFSDGDLKRIQTLINELRDLITASEVFEANHKERVLRKLEKLQTELHKRVSSLDKFWGLLGDAGVALGKFGKDAKPFVDRIREITQIVWRTQVRAEELPSGTTLPLLSAPDHKSDYNNE